MRRPGHWLRLILALLLALAAAILWGVLRLVRDDQDMVAHAMVGVGLALFAVAGIFAVLVGKAARAMARAGRADQRIAAWTVQPGTWAAFVAANERRQAETPGFQTVWTPRAEAGTREVIAARGGLLLDGVFLGVESRGLTGVTGMQWLSGRPECLEFAMRVPVSRGDSLRTEPGLFRVPVEPSQREQAELAFRHYRAFLNRGELSDPSGHRLVVRICLALVVIGLPVGAAGFWMNATGAMAGSQVPALMGGLGILIPLGAAVIALAVWSVMLRRPRR